MNAIALAALALALAVVPITRPRDRAPAADPTSGAAAVASPKPAAKASLAATRELAARLARAGRGEASVTVSRSDPLGGPDREDRGQLALEPSDRVRLDFPSTGERIALRGDGGEWVQPSAKQLVKIRHDQAGLAAWLWEVFLAGGGDAFAERPAGERRYTLEPRDPQAGLPSKITITIDARGLPTEVRFVESEGSEIRYRFRGWTFRSAKGAKAFTLTAPKGYAVVDLP